MIVLFFHVYSRSLFSLMRRQAEKPMIEGFIEREISNAVDAFVETEESLEEYQVILEKEESSRLYREFF